MAQVWSILIDGNVPAKFNPDVFGTAPGNPLKAQSGDLVSWNNQTSDRHQIQVASTFTTNLIEAARSSTPGYVVAGTVAEKIPYKCTQHTGESGTILVVAEPVVKP